MKKSHLLARVSPMLLLMGLATPAFAQTATTAPAQSDITTIDEIVVTANRREQALNNVGLTIQAASGEELTQRGISSVADLAKLVPGFTFTQSIYSTPVFTLRGIGLYDATFGAAPSVAIYTDQIARNVPVMSDGLDLDIERLEVLKGPQGTLFGQSATGGAINYIVGKPTDDFAAGFDTSYERFDRVESSAFVSGPISDTLQARLAVKGVSGGAWQRSVTRPDDENGDQRKLLGRLTLEWQPTDRLHVMVMATGSRDRSDPLAPQYAGTTLNYYPTQAAATASGNPYAIVDAQRYADLTTPSSAGYDASFGGRQSTVVGRLSSPNAAIAAGARALLGTPVSDNARDAEWTAGFLNASDNTYFQFAGQADYSISDTLTLTYSGAYAKQELEYNQDLDGTAARVVDVPLIGDVEATNQELRLAVDTDRFHGLVGAVYDDLKTSQDNLFYLGDYSANADLITVTSNEFDSRSKSYGIFANGEYEIMPGLTIQGGVRYTKTELDATYCYSDPTGAGAAVLFGSALNSVPITIAAGQCFPTTGDILLGTAQSTLTPVDQSLDQDNTSFRVGANYKFDQGTLIYATISQGYKAGIFSAIGASRVNQYTPATQEKVIAYEVGFKAPIDWNGLQFNGAAFYYDYTDKQVRGRVQDTVFGLLEKMLNVPESYVFGLEADVRAQPIDGLNVSASVTYLKSEVSGDYSATPDGLAVYNAQGYRGNFNGSDLPYTPEFSGNIDLQYEFPAFTGWNGFAGGTLTYTSDQNTTFQTDTVKADDFEIDAYTLLDLRVGLSSEDGRWRATAYGRNVTDESYVTAISTYLDTLVRYRGKPALYGVSLAYRF